MAKGAFFQDAALDQVFLRKDDVLKKIASFAGIKKTETVLEIGTGLGNLTRILAKKSKKVNTIEIDERLKPRLRDLEKVKNVEIIWGNALEVLEKDDIEFDKVISNPPYSISEPLIKMLFRKKFKTAVLTHPWKFVERLLANPEEHLYSKLSMFTHAFFITETLMRVPDDSWSPKQDASSIVIRLNRKEDGSVKDIVLRELVLQDDKKLKNAMREAVIRTEKFTKRKARNTIDDLGFPKNLLDKKISEMRLEEIEKVIRKMV